jgi:biopolymer transport protein ExbD
MRVPRRPSDPGVRFNITPLIDVCFNLIVFFAVASLYVKRETAEPVALPQASKADANDRTLPRRLVLTLRANRHVYVEGQDVTDRDIDQIVSERCGGDPNQFELRLRADKAVPYGDVKPIILACARHGISNLKFAVQGP